MPNILKSFLFLLILYIELPYVSYSQSGWIQLNSPTNKGISSVFFINSNTGFIGCDSGGVYKTIDGGNTWTNLSIQNVNPVSSVYFVSNDTGFIGSLSFNAEGSIFKTTSSGQNWISINVIPYLNVRDISFPNANTGFIANFLNILKTTDDGLNWDTLRFSGNGSNNSFYSIYFENSLTGFVVGDEQISIYSFPRIWKTINGGMNWSLVYNVGSHVTLTDIFFITA